MELGELDRIAKACGITTEQLTGVVLKVAKDREKELFKIATGNNDFRRISHRDENSHAGKITGNG